MRPEKRKALKSFSYFWKLEDEEWLYNRKELWREIQSCIFNRYEVKGLRVIKNFFIFGHLDSYVHEIDIYFSTPLIDKEDSDLFFNSDVFSVRNRENILKRYLGSKGSCSGNSWIIGQLFDFIEHRLNNLESDVMLLNEVVYRPSDFIGFYLGSTASLFQGSCDYDISVDTFGYFKKILSSLNDGEAVKRIRSPTLGLEKIIEVCPQIMAMNDRSQHVKYHAQQLKDNEKELLALIENLPK